MGLRGALALVVLALAATAQEWPKELPREGRDALARDGVWVGPKEFSQVFEPYAEHEPTCPAFFITTDGPIAAGYRLMERTVMRMERWSFARLPRGLKGLEGQLGEVERKLKLPADTAAAASRRARLVVAVARLLVGDAPEDLDDAALAQARECAALVEKAEGRSMPQGLGPADAGWLGFDWRVFRPRGPYAGDERTERAFRATRWLQSVPFRLERDEEVAALWLLVRAEGGTSGYDRSPRWGKDLLPLVDGYSDIDEARLHVDDDEGFGPAQLDALRAGLRKALAGRAATDLLHEVPRADEVRPAPWVLLPENRILFGLLHPEGRPPLPGAGCPAGLAVATALGSPVAREALALRDLGAIDGRVSLTEGTTWIAAAHRMRAALLDPAEPEAPPLFSSPAWQRKSLRTALGSWALERNVWTLHGGPVMNVFGGPTRLPGLVEPDPDVFARLAEMGRCVLGWAKDSQLDDQAMRIEYADGVRAEVERAVQEILDPKPNPLGWSEEHLLRWMHRIGVLDPGDRVERRRSIREMAAAGEDVAAEIRAARERLAPVLAACERWHARMVDLSVKPEGEVPGARLQQEWERWIDLCTRLELLAHKQLRQRPWSDEDTAFLKRYGVALGEAMGYPPASVLIPRDDAPRAAAVLCDPLRDVMRVVGTGRPRELWVLYPYRGEKVLCRGVVLSYYELDAKQAPTDAEWKAMLDSKEDRPPEPPWITGP